MSFGRKKQIANCKIVNWMPKMAFRRNKAASFGGTNIDPSAWGDKKNHGETRFPAQVRVVTRKICEPLEDSFRPILHHYDGPKFRLELNIPEDDIEKVVTKLEERIQNLEEGSCMDAIIFPLHGSLPPELQAEKNELRDEKQRLKAE